MTSSNILESERHAQPLSSRVSNRCRHGNFQDGAAFSTSRQKSLPIFSKENIDNRDFRLVLHILKDYKWALKDQPTHESMKGFCDISHSRQKYFSKLCCNHGVLHPSFFQHDRVQTRCCRRFVSFPCFVTPLSE